MSSILISLLLLVASYTIVPHAYALEKAAWRDYYAKVYSIEAIKSGTKEMLNSYKSASHDINNAVRLAKDGKHQEAVRELLGNNDEEPVFIKGIIYETMGFFPEAVGNYTRLVQFYPNGKFFKKAVIRNAFLKLIKGLKTDSISLVKEASRDFYRVYKESDEPDEWKDAIAGYAVTLSIIKEDAYADEVFRKVEGHISLNPSYQFFIAENYLKMGRLKEAKALFQKLLETQRESNISPYINLRLGDISILEGRDAQGELFYNEMIKTTKSLSDTGIKETSDTVIMGTMALSESYMKKGKNNQVIKLLKGFLEKPIDAAVNDSARYYLIKLLKAEGSLQEAISLSNKFLASYPMSTWKKDVEAIRDDIIYTSISNTYNNGDYQKTSRFYYENKPFIKDERLLIMIGESLLHLNLPKEAEGVYKFLKKGKGIKGSLGLAKSFIMDGNAKKSIEIIKGISSLKNEERMEVARVYYMIGNHYFRTGEYEDALRSYSLAQKGGMDEPDLHLKTGRIYELLGRRDDAVKIYEGIVLKTSNEILKAKAFIRLGDIYYISKEWENSLSFYAKGVQYMASGEERLKFIYKMGEANISIGKKREAVAAWQEVEREDKGYLGKLASERLQEVKTWEILQM